MQIRNLVPVVVKHLLIANARMWFTVTFATKEKVNVHVTPINNIVVSATRK